MVNLLYCGPSLTDSVSFYRGWGVLTSLCDSWPNLHVEYCTDVNWSTLKKGHIVFVQRPFTPNYVKLIEIAKLNGKKVWVDYDDNLFSIPHDNPNCPTNPQEIRKSIIQALTMADVVTVSTKELMGVYGSFNPNIEVIPNAYDKKLFHYREKELKQPLESYVFWRGSKTHDNDLLEITSSLVRVAEKSPEITWVFIGDPFWHTIQELKRIPEIKIIQIPIQDPIYYFKTIYEMRPLLQIVPLSDNIFNRAKSNIAWIEGTHAGAGVLAPSFEEWQKPGVFNYEGKDNFGDMLEMLLKMGRPVQNVKTSEQYIEDNLLLDIVNLKRKKIIEGLL